MYICNTIYHIFIIADHTIEEQINLMLKYK